MIPGADPNDRPYWMESSLTDVPDSCYRRGGFFVNDSEETVYGDQGQEVAWEVWQDCFVAKHEIRDEGQEVVAYAVGGERVRQHARCERAFQQQQQTERDRQREHS